MRSIGYLITGRPTTMDDFLHLSRKQPPTRVEVSLGSEEFIADRTVITELVARYDWRFPALTACCEQVCGRLSLLDDRPTRRRRLERANESLQRSLERLRARGIAVSHHHSRFDQRRPGRAVQ